jgi:hypothetical protein
MGLGDIAVHNTYLDAGSHHSLVPSLISLGHHDPVGREYVHPAARYVLPLTPLLRAWDSFGIGFDPMDGWIGLKRLDLLVGCSYNQCLRKVVLHRGV